MIDKKFIGYQLKPSRLYIDRTRLQFFAKAIGEQDPVYVDQASAKAAGLPPSCSPPSLTAEQMSSS